MAIFEAGIITKMTENEYEKLGKEKEISSTEIAENVAKDTNKDLKRQIKAEEENERLKPISLKMLQGAFYILCFGNVFSGIILIGELVIYKRLRNKNRKRRTFIINRWKKIVKLKIIRSGHAIINLYKNAMQNGFVPTEYIE